MRPHGVNRHCVDADLCSASHSTLMPLVSCIHHAAVGDMLNRKPYTSSTMAPFGWDADEDREKIRQR